MMRPVEATVLLFLTNVCLGAFAGTVGAYFEWSFEKVLIVATIISILTYLIVVRGAK